MVTNVGGWEVTAKNDN